MTVLSADSRRIRTAELRKYHEHLLKAVDVPDALFLPKSQYIPNGKDEPFVGFFVSELRKGVDIYTESVTHDLTPEDPKNPKNPNPKRILYKWIFNPHWESEYEAITSQTSTHPRYIVPVAELVEVKMPESEEESPFIEDLETIRTIQGHGRSAVSLNELSDVVVKNAEVKLKEAFEKAPYTPIVNSEPDKVSYLDKPIRDLTLREVITALNELIK